MSERILVPRRMVRRTCGIGGPGGPVYNREGVPDSAISIEKGRRKRRYGPRINRLWVL